MMAKYCNGVWLPDREKHMVPLIEQGPHFAGAGTFQLKKFAAAFPYIRNFRQAVDVGAHCGLWTRVMARCFQIVHAFEPNADVEEYFWMNNPWRRDNERSQIVFKRVALGHEPGMLRLNTKLPKSTAFTRLDPEGDMEVEVQTLDSFGLKSIDFIKIDVEGWEENVIRGGERTIRACQPTMIIEQKPGNAERHGLRQFGATELLELWGARRIAEVSGDIILRWK